MPSIETSRFELPNLRLTLDGRAENVLLVREALAGLAESINLGGDDLHDIRTAVTEASNNAVEHAYQSVGGPLEVEVYVLPEAVEVVVRDQGAGIQPQIAMRRDGRSGLGVPLIQTLAHSVEFIGEVGSGTEVRMLFAAAGIRAPEPPVRGVHREHGGWHDPDGDEDAGPIGLIVCPPSLAGAILARVLNALGSRANFPASRAAAIRVLADALAAEPEDPDGEAPLCVTISLLDRDLHLRAGPFSGDRAQRLIEHPALAELAPSVERAAEREPGRGSPEMLMLKLASR